MRIAIGADHAGYVLKDEIGAWLTAHGHEVLDLGTDGPAPVDYPDYSEAVGMAVRQGSAERGIVVCGSGAGACIAANKLNGIRATLSHDTYSAHQSVEHDDANVLCIGSRIVGPALATEIVAAFVGAQFQADVERYQRRLDKVNALERADSPSARM